MRNEVSGKRLSAISVLQREIVSTRCKAIDIDWRWFCDVCGRAYLFVEESVADAESKTVTETKRHAAECKYPAKALVVQYINEDNAPVRFRVKDCDTNIVSEYTREEFADLAMSFCDAHDRNCPMPRGVTWEQEKAANGGSPWRKSS